MRIPKWPVLVCGMLLATMVGRISHAAEPRGGSVPAVTQADGLDYSGLFDDDDDSDAEAYQPVDYATPAPAEGYFGGGYAPPTMPAPTAWPEMSPFLPPGYNRDQIINDDGIWQRDLNNQPRKVTVGIEFLYGKGLKPGSHLIGSRKFNNLFFFPAFPQIFPHQFTNAFSNLDHYGVRGWYGVENYDQSGFMWSAFVLFPREATAGPGRQYFNDGNFSQLSTHLIGIPLDDGGDGEIVPFDSAFQQTYDQTIWGTDIDVYMEPFLASKNFRLQALWGVKYLGISESFNVTAGDSGLGYIITLPDGTIDLSTVTNIGIPPYELKVFGRTKSQLVGPDIGVRYDLGGDHFKLWGQSKFGVAANFEKLTVGGANVVNGFDANALRGPRVQHTKSTTHLSPFFDTSIYAEFPLFSMIPYVNRWSFINKANFRVGYNYVVAWEIARPSQIIDYKLLDPQITTKRTWFSYNTISFAIDWRF
jgi:hypothetical protein